MTNDVTALAAAVATLPAQYANVKELMERVEDCSLRRRRMLEMIQDGLLQLRLDMKYLIFDLEATRRERDALQR